MLYLSCQYSSLQNMHFTDDLVGFWPLDAVEEYNSEPVYLESNSNSYHPELIINKFLLLEVLD